MAYGWIIDFEWFPDEGYGEARTITGPQNAHSVVINNLMENPEAGKRFQMYDDDNNVIYAGRLFTDDPGSEDEFAPLDEFGAPNAGCTRIDYYEDGVWKTL